MQSSLWSLAKQPHKRDTGFIFFGREVQSELLSSETLYHLWRGAAEIMANLCILQGTQKEAGKILMLAGSFKSHYKKEGREGMWEGGKEGRKKEAKEERKRKKRKKEWKEGRRKGEKKEIKG